MRKILKDIFLKAESPKKAWYTLKLEDIGMGYIIEKQSGTEGKVLHKVNYYEDNLESAEAFYNKKIQQKTSPNRKRKYSIVR